MGKYQPFLDLPAAPGVYVLRDINGDAVYVGRASNIAKRVRAHRSAPWFRLVASAEAVPCSTGESVWRERALIWELAPIANIAGQNWTRYRDRIIRLLRKGGLSESNAARVADGAAPLFCECPDTDADPARNFGQCSTCKRKPLALMAVQS